MQQGLERSCAGRDLRCTLIALAALVLVGCGGDDCAELGLYSCSVTVETTSCPNVDPHWTDTLQLKEKICDKYTWQESDYIIATSCEVTCMFEITPGTHGVDGVLACQSKCLNGFCSTRARMFCVPV